MESAKTRKRIKKFNIDVKEDREEYEDIINNPNITILKEQSTYDKTQQNTMLITVWWLENVGINLLE